MLRELLLQHREHIEARSRELFLALSVPKPTNQELDRGVPILIEQLIDALGREERDVAEADVRHAAAEYGARLFALGFTVAQLVHAYGALSRVVTDLAGELHVDIPPHEYEVLNRVLDVAIAEAVTEYQRRRDEKISAKEMEHVGVLAHELRNALSSAVMAFDVIKKGTVALRGRTGDVLERSMIRMRDLIDHTLAEIRLRAEAKPLPEHLRLAEVLDEISATSGKEAADRGMAFDVEVDHEVEIDADRQLLVSAVSNLVQNALKYTHANGHVLLRGHAAGDRVLVDVEDECGGLPAYALEELFRPFVRGAHQGPGMGLGLSIVRRAVEALGGEIRVHNRPGTGCMFTIDLPRVSQAHEHAVGT